MADACLRVLDPGLLASVQDAGRPGMGGLGIAAGGAADQTTLCAVNEVLENALDAACIELTLTGGAFTFGYDACFALGGAPAAAWLERAGGGREGVAWWTVVAARAGDVLRVGHTRAGARVSLGIAGGVRTPAMMGSRSTHVGAGFPMPALRAGDVLALDADAARRVQAGVSLTERRVRGIERAVFRETLRVVVGPHAGALERGALERFLSTEFIVSSESSRAGVRLSAVAGAASTPGGVSHGRMLTQPMAPGFVQVPADGRAIILGREHPTTGGYPVIASVIAADLDAVGQLRPGRTVRFVRATMEDAQRAWRERPLPDCQSRSH